MSTDNKPEPQDALPPLPEPRFAAWADSPGRAECKTPRPDIFRHLLRHTPHRRTIGARMATWRHGQRTGTPGGSRCNGMRLQGRQSGCALAVNPAERLAGRESLVEPGPSVPYPASGCRGFQIVAADQREGLPSSTRRGMVRRKVAAPGRT